MNKNYIIGKKNIKEALNGNILIKEIYIDKNKKDNFNLFLKNNINIFKIPIVLKEKKDLDKLIGNVKHKGIIGIMNSFKYYNFDYFINKLKTKKSFFLILDHIEDPYNFGSIIRTSLCANVDGIIIPKKRSVKVTSTVIKVSAGAVFHIPIIQVNNIINIINIFKKNNYWIHGISQKGKSNLFETKIMNPLVLILGNENKGISSLVEKNCDNLIRIPQKNKIDSLNVGVASAIVIYKVFENNISKGK